MIYILEDDESIRELLAYSFDKTGNSTAAFSHPSELFSALESNLPDLILLDVMLPEQDGISVLSKIRSSERTSKIPVIMLTAKGSEFDKVTALDLGADDYVTKPFGVMELLARVNAVLRRCDAATHKATSDFAAGPVSVDLAKHEVTVCGAAVMLTLKEFELLALLFENRGTVLSRNKILQDVWGYEFDGESRTVDVHVRTMRQKLGAGADIIETVRGVGYKIR